MTAFVVLFASTHALADIDVAVVNTVPGDGGIATIAGLESTLRAAKQPGVVDPDVRAALETVLPKTPSPDASLALAAAVRKKAFDSYAAFKYQRAISQLDEGDRVAIMTLPSAKGIRELGELSLLRAQVLLQSGDVLKSNAEFRLASDLLGTVRLDPGLYSPDVIEAFEKAVANQSERALLIAPGSGIAVFVDGTWRPGTEIEVGVGRHFVVLSQPGFETIRRIVRMMRSGGSHRLRAEMEPLPVPERIRSLRLVIAKKTMQPAAALGRIAAAAQAKRLLVVRETPSGIGVQLFVAATETLSTTEPATRETVSELIAPATIAPEKVVKNPGTKTTTRPSWIKRHKTAVIVTSGTVVVIAAVAVTLLLTSGGDTKLSVDTYCGFGIPCE